MSTEITHAIRKNIHIIITAMSASSLVACLGLKSSASDAVSTPPALTVVNPVFIWNERAFILSVACILGQCSNDLSYQFKLDPFSMLPEGGGD